jgi:hypothetical protein
MSIQTKIQVLASDIGSTSGAAFFVYPMCFVTPQRR